MLSLYLCLTIKISNLQGIDVHPDSGFQGITGATQHNQATQRNYNTQHARKY